ncbi:MAG: FAD-dependent oxidoreductase [Ruminococcaceae bacterium]|nr:FAD-dependent oxidoreductase [Oscillospiraceae bacterium]
MANVFFPIQKTYDCDVLVVGGGVAGISAAVNAAREGARVILCESGGCLGGTATKGLVGPFMTCYDAEGKNRIIRGFFSEFVERMIAEGGAISYEDCPGNNSHSGYRLKGHIGVTPFMAETMKRVAETLCREAGVRVLYHNTLIGCDTEQRRIRTAYLADNEGISAVTASVFIDASGSASLAAKAGAETFRGDENGFLQTASLFFVIDGVHADELNAYMAEHNEMRERFYMDIFDKGIADGSFPCGTQKLRIYERPDGSWLVNMAQTDNGVNELDSEALSEAEIDQRAQTVKIFEFLKKNIPALRDIRYIQSATDLGVRESRRMAGRVLLTGEDVANSRYAEEQIAVCANSIDIHQAVGVQYVAYKAKKNYYIPLSALISKDVDNLLAAGKCLSADKYAHAAIRVMPPCFAMGEAAGITAALAVKKSCAAAEVPVTEVQAIIRAHGGYLE